MDLKLVHIPLRKCAAVHALATEGVPTYTWGMHILYRHEGSEPPYVCITVDDDTGAASLGFLFIFLKSV